MKPIKTKAAGEQNMGFTSLFNSLGLDTPLGLSQTTALVHTPQDHLGLVTAKSSFTSLSLHSGFSIPTSPTMLTAITSWGDYSSSGNGSQGVRGKNEILFNV